MKKPGAFISSSFLIGALLYCKFRPGFLDQVRILLWLRVQQDPVGSI